MEIFAGYSARISKEMGFTARTINIGGGFGVRYTHKDPQIDIPARIREISEHLKAACAKYGIDVPDVYMEPGRSIVADAGVTL